MILARALVLAGAVALGGSLGGLLALAALHDGRW